MNDKDSEEPVLCELPPKAELNKPFRNASGSRKKFSVYTKNESGDVVKVSFGDPDMKIRRDDPVARKAFRDRFSCDTDPGPKWKPKYWSCHMWDSETVSEITAMKQTTTSDFNGVAPEEILFMPKGKTQISASSNGKPKLVSVDVTEETAALLASQLQQSIDAAKTGVSSRPFIDFNHDHGRAAAIPLEIGWDPERGVIARVEWTPSGRAAVEGKEFSYFSPEFAWSEKTKQITGLVQPGSIGSLVNIPAFQQQETIAASLSTPTPMDISKLFELLKTFGIELSPEADMETMCAALDAKMKCMVPATDLNAVTASLNDANERIKQFEKAENDRVQAAATSFVDETIKAGHVSADSREHWLKLATSDLAGTKAILASFQPAAKQDGPPGPITITAAHNPNAQKRKEELARLVNTETDPQKRSALFQEWSSL